MKIIKVWPWEFYNNNIRYRYIRYEDKSIYVEFEKLKRPYFFGNFGFKKWKWFCTAPDFQTGLLLIEKIKL